MSDVGERERQGYCMFNLNVDTEAIVCIGDMTQTMASIRLPYNTHDFR